MCVIAGYLIISGHIPQVHSEPGAVLMLGQRQRRWPNIETSLSQRPVLSGYCLYSSELMIIVVTQDGARRKAELNWIPQYIISHLTL